MFELGRKNTKNERVGLTVVRVKGGKFLLINDIITFTFAFVVYLTVNQPIHEWFRIAGTSNCKWYRLVLSVKH